MIILYFILNIQNMNNNTYTASTSSYRVVSGSSANTTNNGSPTSAKVYRIQASTSGATNNVGNAVTATSNNTSGTTGNLNANNSTSANTANINSIGIVTYTSGTTTKIVQNINSNKTPAVTNSTLIQEYNRRLESQNLAKTKQIKQLRQQFQNNKNVKVISNSYSSGPCSNCRNKDNEIASLNRLIHSLKQDKQRQLSIYKQERQQYNAVQRLCDQLKAKLEQAQKVQWNSIKVEHNQNYQAIRQQNMGLAAKVQELEARTRTLEDTNRALTTELLNNQNISCRPNVIQTTTLPPTIPATMPTVHMVPSGMYPRPALVTQPVIFNYNGPAPAPAKTVSFNVPPPMQQQYETVTYQRPYGSQLSPLEVLSPHGIENGQWGHHQYGHKYSHAYNDDDYFKDIVEERWRTLQHKIRLLQSQNNVLRTEMCAVRY